MRMGEKKRIEGEHIVQFFTMRSKCDANEKRQHQHHQLQLPTTTIANAANHKSLSIRYPTGLLFSLDCMAVNGACINFSMRLSNGFEHYN